MKEDQTEKSGALAGSLMDFLTVITRYRVFVSRFVVVTTVGAVILALLLPKWYKSTASIFPSERSDLLGALGGLGSLVTSFTPNKALAALGGNTEADRYIAILKSNTVLSSVVQQFDLVTEYGLEGTTDSLARATEALLDNSAFTAEIEGNITVTVFDKDRQRAADIANYLVDLLNRTNAALQVQNARANREFIEERYNKNIRDLDNAVDSMKAFQQLHGVVALPEQTQASITAAAEIGAELAQKEVEAAVLARTYTPEHPMVVQKKLEIEELARKLRQMNSSSPEGKGEMRVFVPFKEIPSLGAQYVRLAREVEVQSKILEFITPLYEQAKVEEKRQTPSVVVLDRAIAAERKAKPKASLYGLLALLCSSALAIFGVFTFELVLRIRNLYPSQFAAITSAVQKDWFGLRLRRKSR